MPPEPRRPDPALLERRALAYLARYGASSGRLAGILHRRAAPEARAHGLAPEALMAMIDAVVTDLGARGLVDDQGFADGRARALLRRGWRVARVRQALRADGLDDTRIEAALGSALPPGHDPEQMAAVRYARRRGLGPFRTADERARYRDRDLRSLLRQGFAWRLARRIVDTDDAAALDDVLA